MEELLKTPDIAKLLNLAEVTVRKLVSSQRIPYLKIGAAVRFDREAVLRWLESQRCGELRSKATVNSRMAKTAEGISHGK